MSDFSDLKRPTRKESQECLFDLGTQWEDAWWGMPELIMEDASPQYRIIMNFMTREDVMEFAEKIGISVTPKTRSAWFPPQDRLEGGKYFYDGPSIDSRYPVCIMSKGRADCQTTGINLDKLGVSYHFFVEETEAEEYIKYLGENKVIVMPFHDLGQGSIPARNFIWEWCKEREYKRHWTLDDNILKFCRCNLNRRLAVVGGGLFRAMEDFVDRYENIAMAGPHHDGFISDDRSPNKKPFILNSRIYLITDLFILAE